MYSATTGTDAPPKDTAKYVRWGAVIFLAVAIFILVGQRAIALLMNMSEFGDEFTKPLYYSLVSSIVLAAIAFVRINPVKRTSLFWYGISSAISLMGRSPRDPLSQSIRSFREHRLTHLQFWVWQITKVFLFGAFFSNVLFGLAFVSFMDGETLGIETVPAIFTLPFVTPPTDPSYAESTVIPMMPSLLLLVPPVLAAVGVRLVLYIGLHSLANVMTSYIQDASSGKPRYLNYVSTLEAMVGIGILWIGFNHFFTEQIDYNTKYWIAGTLSIGLALIAFSITDRIRAKVLTHMFKRDVLIRICTIIAIAVIVFGFVTANTSIANAKKIEYLGPYTAQQIGVNRHLGELDLVQEHEHDVQLNSISPNNIDEYVRNNADVLDSIRIWDWTAAFAKLKPEIGLIPYVNFEDNDILRFNNTLYWTASMTPRVPDSVQAQNQWYNEHLVYTHVPNGFLTLDATEGQIVDSGEFFQQRAIYYGEGGLLESKWSAYPTERTTSDELNGVFYEGEGGLDVAPPLSWIFEPNFLLSYTAEPIHIMRYKDINARMEALYPYFVYDFFGKELDSYPVTDGTNSYWLVPLIFGLKANDVPWASGNHYIRPVGYALIDTYDGDITLLKIGDDFFTTIFEKQYGDKFEPMPAWLEQQIRYPVELFTWKTGMYNVYHVTDVETFIQANEFYEIPRDLETYYIRAKPPGFEKPEFIGLLSLELKGSQGRNLAGFMIVQNDLPTLGNMQFYEVPLNSTTKLIGPTAVREALDRDPDFAQLKTLLRNPRVGDNILYQVGEHDTYFIPVYTAGAGGVVAQLGTIAAVGASFTGEYHVGLGDTQQDAFQAYLQKLSGVSAPANINGSSEAVLRDDRLELITSLFEEADIDIVRPTAIQIPISFQVGEIFFYSEAERGETLALLEMFIENHIREKSDRIIMWEEENIINFGTIVIREGIPEMHYVSVGIGT